MTRHRLTLAIIAAMLMGIACGGVIRWYTTDPIIIEYFASNLSLLSDLFMRLIKMIIAPLVLSTLVVGIAKLGDLTTIGRLGIKALGYFMAASLVSLTLGIILVNLFQPGDSMHLPIPEHGSNASLPHAQFSIRDFFNHVIPKNIVEAMGNNEILQIDRKSVV